MVKGLSSDDSTEGREGKAPPSGVERELLTHRRLSLWFLCPLLPAFTSRNRN